MEKNQLINRLKSSTRNWSIKQKSENIKQPTKENNYNTKSTDLNFKNNCINQYKLNEN